MGGHIYTPNALGWISGMPRKSSFQGSLYLSRESLGNHFFEAFQKSISIYMQACPKTQSPGGHPLVFMFLFFDFEL
jgi:hypothetical protein